MSLILEALKKAERQHKLGEVPKITPDNQQSAPVGTRRLGWLMMTLLALTLLGIGVYLGSNNWLSPQQRTHLPQTSYSVEVPGDAGPTPETGDAKPLHSPQALNDSAKVQAPPGSQPVYDQPPAMPASKEETFEPPPVAEVQPQSLPAPVPPRPLHEMPSGFVAHLPAMSIDIHSYDKSPAKRYVLINMEKYHEGDYIAEGPRVVEILPDGAVMEHMGERFILPIGNQ